MLDFNFYYTCETCTIATRMQGGGHRCYVYAVPVTNLQSPLQYSCTGNTWSEGHASFQAMPPFRYRQFISADEFAGAVFTCTTGTCTSYKSKTVTSRRNAAPLIFDRLPVPFTCRSIYMFTGPERWISQAALLALPRFGSPALAEMPS